MPELRKSAKQTDARRRAREKATQFCELQDMLEQLATDYFIAVDSLAELDEETAREVSKLRERAEKKSQKARDEADRVIVRMVDAGASATEVAARLGVQVRDIKKATKARPAPTAPDSSSSTTGEATSSGKGRGGSGQRTAARCA